MRVRQRQPSDDGVVVDPPAAVVVVGRRRPSSGSNWSTAWASTNRVRAWWRWKRLMRAACRPERSTTVFVDPPVLPFSAKPTKIATRIATTICHVFQVRFSLMWSSPGAGIGSTSTGSNAARIGAVYCYWTGGRTTYLNRGREFDLRQDGDSLVSPLSGSRDPRDPGVRLVNNVANSTRDPTLSRFSVLTELTYHPPAVWETSIS